jgi:smad nuclear-interacting protein 1
MPPSGATGSKPSAKSAGGVLPGGAGYKEPSDAAKPDRDWLFVVMKGDKKATDTPTIKLNKSFVLFGRDEKTCGASTLMHGSISRQHAGIQFRRKGGSIKPFLIDLSSTHGTFLNQNKLEPKKYEDLEDEHNTTRHANMKKLEQR